MPTDTNAATITDINKAISLLIEARGALEGNGVAKAFGVSGPMVEYRKRAAAIALRQARDMIHDLV